jgi:putative membrane protein
VVASIAEEWPFEPVVAAACLLVLALFVQGFVRLRRRGRRDHAGWGRAVLFVTAVSLTYLALASPISAVGEDRLLAAHMLEHLLFADLAIALGMLAVRGPLVLFLFPPSILGPLARSPGLRRFLHRLTGPWVALAIWTTSMWAWHLPRLYELAATHPLVHSLEHASFFLGGLLVWNLLIDPARRERITIPSRIALAVAVFFLGDLVMGAILDGTFTYSLYDEQPDRALGLSPAEDRRAAALLMFSEQLLTLGICIVVLLLRLPREAAGTPATGGDGGSPSAAGREVGASSPPRGAAPLV